MAESAAFRYLADINIGFGVILQRAAFMEEQSKLAERILDQVADAVIYANYSGTIIRWNHASTALFWLFCRRGTRPKYRTDHSRTSASPTLERLQCRDEKRRLEASGPSDTQPRSTQERTQAVRRDEPCDCERRHRKRGAWRGRHGARCNRAC